MVQAYASLAFECPIDGPTPVERVLDILSELDQAGADKLVLADTLGKAIPDQVGRVIKQVLQSLDLPTSRLGVHLHDANNLAGENAVAAWRLGVRHFDASIGGLGGCNFMPGAKGNISIEKLCRSLSQEVGADCGSVDMSVVKETNAHLTDLFGRRLEQ